MRRGVLWRVFGCCLLLGLGGCARMWFTEEREPWRHEAEISCLKSGAVKEGPSVAITRAIEGPGACGIDYPLRVAGLGETALASFTEESNTPRAAAVAPAATLACPMVSALDRFVSDAVQPAATRWFGQPVVNIKQISAYSCRGMNDVPGARISEHAFGNALDIAAFTLADGHTITVKDGWQGTPAEQGFLHDVQESACSVFTTVLAPGSNAYHEDHMHVDLMRRSSRRTICEPAALPGEAASFRAGGHYGSAHRADVAAASAARR
jgi:hypothetical protein